MSLYTESGIEVDLTAAQSHETHENYYIWSGVDSVIIEEFQQVWLELKNWNAKEIEDERRDAVRDDFLAKMRSDTYPQKLLDKFLGTCSFLTLTGTPPNAPISYVLLFECPPIDTALRSHLMTRIGRLVLPKERPERPWSHAISVIVVDVAEWNVRFPQYPARLL
jgi:hypothetical protein